VPSLWSAFLFFCVAVFGVGLLVSFAIALQIGAGAFILAAVLAFAADRLRPSVSTVGAPSGGAAAFWSVICLLIGIGQAMGWRDIWTMLLLIGAAAWGAAMWRWGYPVFAVLAAVFFFLLLARSPQARALWLILGVALAAACVPLLDRPSLSPSHRRSAAAALTVALAAVYVALNLYSLDHRVLERGLAAGWSQTDVPNGAERSLAAAATALFPIFILAW